MGVLHMKSIFSATLLAGILAMVSATQAQLLEHSGHIFHMRVCGGQNAPAGVARCHAHIVTDSAGHPWHVQMSQGRVMPNTTPAVQVYYLPAQLRAAYGITGLGSPHTIVAIVDAYAYPGAASDLAIFRAATGLPPCNNCLKIVNEMGGNQPPAQSDPGWDLEQALDLDMVSTMCPNCRILLVEANSPNFGDLARAENAAAFLGAHSIGNSYGGSEIGSVPYSFAYDHPGVAITASAGDYGYGVVFPASSPSVIAVGGTSLIWTGSSRTETAWSGSGSGCSTVYSEPIWQSFRLPGTANNTLCTKRMMNDVSAVADLNTGVIVYMGGNFYVFGGTSVAAQIINGIYGEKGDSVLYGSGLYLGYRSLFDVTSGSDGSCGGTYFCTAIPGYDGPTGLGTPNGDKPF